jgi:uncharacterized protein (UPF0548 family)
MLSVSERVLPNREAEQLRNAGFTYSEVGSTRGDTMPSGYRSLRRGLRIGAGSERFEQAARVLLGWDMHRRAGLRVRTSNEHVVQGAVAVLRLGVGGLGVSAPVRVVYLVDEPRRKGFAYGTLPGHPESGEEAFVAELHDDSAVTFTITAFSRPSTLLARVGGPVGSAIQSWVTNRYLRAV